MEAKSWHGHEALTNTLEDAFDGFSHNLCSNSLAWGKLHHGMAAATGSVAVHLIAFLGPRRQPLASHPSGSFPWHGNSSSQLARLAKLLSSLASHLCKARRGLEVVLLPGLQS